MVTQLRIRCAARDRIPTCVAALLNAWGTVFLCLMLGMAVGACSRSGSGATAAGGAKPMEVVCTTGMIADITRNIGGARVRVKALMGEGVDPHLYKASPGDVQLLSDADVVFYNGLHLEGRMADVLVKLARSKPVVAVSEKIDPALLREPPEFQGNYDPHIWFDVSLWIAGAERVRDELARVDAAGKAVYEKNADGYLAALRELHGWCKTEIARLPQESRVLITAHDAFGYFGRAYGMEVHGIQGISTDSEAGIQEINALVDLIVSRNLRAVFVESSVSPKTIEALVEGATARKHNVRVGGELFSDAMGADGTPQGTYIGMVRHNVSTIVGALLEMKPAAHPGGGP